MNDKYTPDEVDYKFGSINSVDEKFREIVDNAVSHLPKEIVDWVTKKVFFVSSCDEYLAFSINFKDWKHLDGFIFLSENLRKKPEKSQTFTIVHEIAHQKLKHVSLIAESEKENTMEREANDLAFKWLGPEYEAEYENHLKLRRKLENQFAKLNKS